MIRVKPASLKPRVQTYLLHAYVVIALQSALLGFELPGLAKFSIVTVAGIVLTLLIVDLFRRLPRVRAVV